MKNIHFFNKQKISQIFNLVLISLLLENFNHVALAEDNNSKNKVSPARNIIHKKNRTIKQQNNINEVELEYRTYDGSYNNLDYTAMGSSLIELLRLAPAKYSDGNSSLAGIERPSPRHISNIVLNQTTSIPNPHGATDYLWQWGQFLDHDIDLTDGVEPDEHENIGVPTGDIYFDPNNTGTQTIPFNRSIYEPTSQPRQQINEITAWIDASNVYGSDKNRANALRTFAGDGKLKTSSGNLLPFNLEGLANAGGDSPELFVAGDVRANEQIGLTAMHTLFVREHNRLAEIISNNNPDLDGETIYQKARKLVGAEMQMITYREYLPELLGKKAIAPYSGYNPDIDASIANGFSTAAYRYGHSALNSQLLRLDKNGNEIAEGHVPLRGAFFRPDRIINEGGIEPFLRGFANQACQTIDNQIVFDIRNFLFGEPGNGGFDLASLNIQRGRDHGLPSYNEMRVQYGMHPAFQFSDISSNPSTQDKLAKAYQTVDQVDLWVGGLSEDPVNDSHLGPLFHTIIKEQFEALRDGDRYWYELTLTKDEKRMIDKVKLSDIIRFNTNIDGEIQDNVFKLADEKRRNKNSRK